MSCIFLSQISLLLKATKDKHDVLFVKKNMVSFQTVFAQTCLPVGKSEKATEVWWRGL